MMTKTFILKVRKTNLAVMDLFNGA